MNGNDAEMIDPLSLPPAARPHSFDPHAQGALQLFRIHEVRSLRKRREAREGERRSAVRGRPLDQLAAWRGVIQTAKRSLQLVVIVRHDEARAYAGPSDLLSCQIA